METALKLIFKIVCLFIIFFNITPPLSASGNVYKLSYETELAHAGAGLAAKVGAHYLGRDQNTLGSNDLQSLSRSDANCFDRSATFNGSEHSDMWSSHTRDILLCCLERIAFNGLGDRISSVPCREALSHGYHCGCSHGKSDRLHGTGVSPSKGPEMVCSSLYGTSIYRISFHLQVLDPMRHFPCMEIN
ncbi:MAG: hypothetical protein KJ737_08575 [Proteobacteria bacterium]|nr:hypothetical protein [Pseudomonadota bacterium]